MKEFRVKSFYEIHGRFAEGDEVLPADGLLSFPDDTTRQCECDECVAQREYPRVDREDYFFQLRTKTICSYTGLSFDTVHEIRTKYPDFKFTEENLGRWHSHSQ